VIVYDLPEAEYHADQTTLSASGAKVLLGKRPPAESDALSFGTLVHVAILEPERLSEYVALDAAAIGVKGDGTPALNPTMTAAWKKAVAEAETDGRTVIDQNDLDRAKAMAAAVFAHPMARRILDLATGAEVSAYTDHPTGARVRARYDLLGPVIADIKTTRDANPKRFGKTADAFGYHISAANYLDIAAACDLDVTGFAFVNVEKEPTPGGEYRVSVTDLTPNAIDLGRRLMAEGCLRWLALGKRIDLPTYGDGFTTVDLPPWAYNNIPNTPDPIWEEAS
jgi:PDDEXK-like domain of unknown function (DUF3799)